MATTNWEDVIAERCDIIVVGSPVGYHHVQTKAALEAGAQVLCEKPFTIDPADSWDLVEAVRRTGKDVIVAYGWNYRPMVIQAHQLMHDDGGIGEIEQLTIHMASATRELLNRKLFDLADAAVVVHELLRLNDDGGTGELEQLTTHRASAT